MMGEKDTYRQVERAIPKCKFPPAYFSSSHLSAESLGTAVTQEEPGFGPLGFG